MGSKLKSIESTEPRRGRDRPATEERILDATWRLFDRGGPLAGINLQEVADEAGVNRSLVYQHFGTREELVRKALAKRLEQARPLFGAGQRLPFDKRRRRAFSIVLANPAPARLMAQLVLAGDGGRRLLRYVPRDAPFPGAVGGEDDGIAHIWRRVEC